ncbi:MAG: tetratricopeptide repeat protein [Armatimonadetes bacterium]|nr:tetratricopeptide repeat protein [Armatimonadota bacterium]
MNKSVRFVLIVVGLMLALGSGLLAEENPGKPSTAGSPATIAVLAFKNLCGDSNLDWLGVGFAESLSTKLSNVSGIQLVERTQLEKALKELKLADTAIVEASTAGKIGKIIGARFVIVGSFQKVGDSIKADARRVDVETSVASSGVEATGKFDQVFEVQSELAIKLAATFGKTVTAEEKAVIAKPETTSVTAYELNAKGLKAAAAGNLDEAASFYNQAIEADPKYAEAYYNRGLLRFARQDFVGAESDLNKAIELDPKDPMAYISRGICWIASMNYPKGMADLNKAIEVAPNDYRGYGARAIAYMNAGNAALALQDTNKVISLNPKLPDAYFARAMCNIALGNLISVEQDYQKGIELGGTPPPELTQMMMLLQSDVDDD